MSLLALLAIVQVLPCRAADCVDRDGDGFFGQPDCGTARDCNDFRATIHPGALEACNGIDDDCSGAIDDDSLCPGVCSTVELPDSEYLIPGAGSVAKVIWTGDRNLVIWQQSASTVGGSMFVTPFDEQAQPLAAATVIPGNNLAPAAVAWNGQSYGVVRMAFTPTAPWGQDLVDVAFTVAGQSPANVTLIEGASGFPHGQEVIWTGNEWGVFWAGRFDRVVPTWSRAPGTRLVTARSVAWNGEEYAIVYYVGSSSAPDLMFARLDATGERIGNPRVIASGSTGS